MRGLSDNSTMSVHMGHTCRLMHALILLFASLLCTAKHLDPNQPHLAALAGLTTVFAPQQLIFSPQPLSPPCRCDRPPNKSANACHHPSGSLWLTPSPLLLLGWPWCQHDMPHLPPCPCTALGLHHSSWCFSSRCCLDQASPVSRQQPCDLHHPDTALRAAKWDMVWLSHDCRF